MSNNDIQDHIDEIEKQIKNVMLSASDIKVDEDSIGHLAKIGFSCGIAMAELHQMKQALLDKDKSE